MIVNNNTDNSRAMIYDENANSTPHDVLVDDSQNIFTDEKPIGLKQIKPNCEDISCQTDTFLEELEDKLTIAEVKLSEAHAKLAENLKPPSSSSQTQTEPIKQERPQSNTVGCQTLPKPEPPARIITRTQVVCQNCYEMEAQVEAITQEKIAFLVQFDEKLTEIKELAEENENLQIDVEILKKELAEWQNGTTSMNSSVFQGKPDFQKHDSRKTKMEKRMKQLKKISEKKRGRAMI